MTDNFNNYREFINKSGGLPDDNAAGTLDKYYVIELIRRGKDNPDMPAANYHFKNYYIYSWKDYKKYEEEIKKICSLLKLRAYASVNYKLMSQVALDTMAESARRISKHDYKKFYSIFESCSGKYVNRVNNIWIVDVDNGENINIELLREYINSMQSGHKDNNIIFEIPTKSGLHILTYPFNLKQFNDDWKNVFNDIETPDIKKNHLTLLFENI